VGIALAFMQSMKRVNILNDHTERVYLDLLNG